MSRKAVKCVLVDLSGTLHIEDMEIPGSVHALERLRQSRIQLRLLTNTTKESKRVLYQRLVSLGFKVKQEEISTSLTAARKLLDKENLRPMLIIDDKALEDFEGISSDNPNAVLIGLAPDKFDYFTINKAFSLILNGARFIAIHKARYYKNKAGLSLGPGPFVTALEFSSGHKAHVVGKPEATFFLTAIQDLGCEPGECVMIGDDVRDDIGGAQQCGMKGILVKTGKYLDGDENSIEPKPHFVADNFAAAVDYVISSLL